MTTGVSHKAVALPSRNQAVQFCIDLWKEEYNKLLAKGKTDYNAADAAHEVYREAMPDLISAESVRDFIACVGRGILIRAIDENEATRLLIAARIATQAFAAEHKADQQSEAALDKAQRMAEAAVFKALGRIHI
jgi:hypothetical protein